MRRVAVALAVVVVSCTSPPAVARCPGNVIVDNVPSWAGDVGLPGISQYVMSDEGNAIAVIFPKTLVGGDRTDGASNKVLWVVREPRNLSDLTLEGTPVGGEEPGVSYVQEANSGPGEIYPSEIDVPKPGCWDFTLMWDGNVAHITLPYEPG